MSRPRLSETDIAFIEGLIDTIDDDLPDGAWAAMLQELIEFSGEFNNLDPYDVFIAYVEQTGTETTK
jgi:hypothetical protein